jgi:hypothetical protein
MVHEYKSGHSYASKVSHPPVCFRTWPRLARTRAPTLRGWPIPYLPMPSVRKLVRSLSFPCYSRRFSLRSKHPETRSIQVILLFCFIAGLGCEPAVQVRVYDAPKSDTQFVTGPLAGTSSPSISSSMPRNQTPPASGPRRILGAVIPLEAGCYFLKATDSPERLEPLLADFYDIVSNFAVQKETGRPDGTLPAGWTMNLRNDIAMAEFVSPESKGSVKFTVTVLGMPPASDWNSYLLSNINRWRGQLKLPDLDGSTLSDALVTVERAGSVLPGFIFDAVGSGSGGMSPASGPASSSIPPATSSPGTNRPPTTDAPSESSSSLPTGNPSSENVETRSGRPELQYELPPGWTLVAGSSFRLATFQIASDEGAGEVSVSMAVDNPTANATMWFQTVTREADESKLKPLVDQSVQTAEKIPSGQRQATLYTIRDSEQPDAPVLLVASIPTDSPELNLFVKLRSDNRVAEAQRASLLQFIHTLSIK